MTPNQPFELPPGQALRLPARPQALLQVLRGRVWLTCAGDPDDHFLAAGQHWPLGAAGVVIEADGPVPVQLCMVALAGVQAGVRAGVQAGAQAEPVAPAAVPRVAVADRAATALSR